MGTSLGTSLTAEVAAVTISAVLLGSYFALMELALRKRPLHTMRGIMRAARRSWVEAMLGKGMLPVNTLRDLIRSCQFFASSSLAGAASAAGFVASMTEQADGGLLRFKVICFAISCGVTFLFFMQSTRYYTHVGILINTPDVEGHPVTVELVNRVVKRAADGWANGMNSFLVALPILLWTMGPAYLVVASVLVILLLRTVECESFEVQLGERAPISREASDLQAMVPA